MPPKRTKLPFFPSLQGGEPSGGGLTPPHHHSAGSAIAKGGLCCHPPLPVLVPMPAQR